MEVLQAAPTLPLRKETVDCPELGGAVIVRGLTGSEAFAVSMLKQQAARRARTEFAEMREKAGPEAELPEPELTFDEWRQFGGYTSQMLHLAVQGANGMSLYSAAEWEVMPQHHPALVDRLTAVAERLSGMNAEDVEKNSPSSPPSAPT
jgi:hypothetical protein